MRAQLELTRLSEYTDGWNGPRSLGADPVSFHLASRFVCLLRDSKGLRISPTIFAVGTAALEITKAPFKLLIEFTRPGELAVNIDTPSGPLDYDIVGFDGTKIPEELRRFL